MSPPPFRVKVCGLTTLDNAQQVVAAGADAVGLNFCARSRRAVAPAVAAQIAAELPAEVLRVGLFVDAPREEIAARVADCRLDLIQLHGAESPEFVAALRELGPWPVMKALACGPGRADEVTQFVERCRVLGAPLAAVLLDADVAGQTGGTGRVAHWPTAAALAARAELPPVVLAGGLTPDNVEAAVAAVRPAAVDVSSGVESAPGVKDAARVRLLVAAAGAALARLRGGT